MNPSKVEELMRRKAVSSAPLQERSSEKPSSKPFPDPSQRYVLFHAAGRARRPRSSTPFIRILGLFPSVEAANAHAALVVLPHDHTCSLHIAAACTLNLLSAELEPTAAAAAKQTRLTEAYYRAIVAQHDAFEERRRASATGKRLFENVSQNRAYEMAQKFIASLPPAEASAEAGAEASAEAGAEASAEASAEAEAGAEKEAACAAEAQQTAEVAAESVLAADATADATALPLVGACEEKEEAEWMERAQAYHRRLKESRVTEAMVPGTTKLQPPEQHVMDEWPDTAKVPGQNCVLMAFIPDVERDEEPVFVVLGACATDEEADAFETNVLSRATPEFDICGVSMYKWISPRSKSEMAKEGKMRYRVDEQDRIMSGFYANEERCKFLSQHPEDEASKKIGVMEIEADLPFPEEAVKAAEEDRLRRGFAAVDTRVVRKDKCVLTATVREAAREDVHEDGESKGREEKHELDA